MEAASDHLIGIAQVAAAFVGFSSVVAIFGRGPEGVWEAADRIRMRNLVEQSLAVAVLGFLPVVLCDLHASESTAWSVSSLVLAFLLALDIALWGQRAFVLRRLGSLRIWMFVVGLILLGAALCIQILNLLGLRFTDEAGPYVTGLWLVLLLAGLQFALLVFGRLGDSESARSVDA
jgi:hypothetical protein